MARLARQTWQEVAELGGAALLAVPVGATEQHGPHLPLSTDTEIAVSLVDRLAATSPGVVAAPPLPYGASGEHAGFPGTVSIGAAATEHLLVELCRSARASFSAVLLVSTHGGNAEAVAAAVALLRAEGQDVRSWSPRWGGDAHAGRTETSLMLAIAPSLVRLERAQPGNAEPLAALLPRLRRDGVRASSASGVLGDPRGASAAEGEELLAAALGDLAGLVAAVS